jgi:hypothetical protein
MITEALWLENVGVLDTDVSKVICVFHICNRKPYLIDLKQVYIKYSQHISLILNKTKKPFPG